MDQIRNIAIIAHVDHGKTTLVDCLLKQSGLFREEQAEMKMERILDKLELEREKGITIRAKNASFVYKGIRINIVDTPGHADFGGEVERAMNMIDGVLLVVDAVEGPQAQTRFVLRKALAAGAKPIVVINKIDRPFADPIRVVDEVIDLFFSLNASEEQLEFPIIYTSAKEGYAKRSLDEPSNDMKPLFEAIIEHVPPPRIEQGPGFRFLVASLEWNSYLGRVAFGKIYRGTVKMADPLVCIHGNGKLSYSKVEAIFRYEGLKLVQIDSASAGDIVGIAGFENVSIGETIVDSEERGPLPYIPVDPPTLQMEFAVNDGPLAGRDGQYVTASYLWERLERELRTNPSIRVEQGTSPTAFRVYARGIMQIAILLEQMRREGYEVLVSKPEPVLKNVDGITYEPYEELFLDLPIENLGAVMELLSIRRAQIESVLQEEQRVRVKATIPMRGLIGFETELLTITKGLGVMSHIFYDYMPFAGEIQVRRTGVMVSIENGIATTYALGQLQERGRLFIEPGEQVYEGMIVGEFNKGEELLVNPCKTKHLTNVRSKGEGVGIFLEPPLKFSVERALEFLGPDEYLEVTPHHLRLRKKILNQIERRRLQRQRMATASS